MEHDLKAVTIPPDADAWHALGKMQRGEATRLLVAEGDRLVGIISLSDLLRFLNLKIELEGSEQLVRRARTDRSSDHNEVSRRFFQSNYDTPNPRSSRS